MRQEPYTCERCDRGPPLARCKRCRAKRAERRCELRALKAKAGICLDCLAPAERAPDGSLFTRCRDHRLMNNALSSASHAVVRSPEPQPQRRRRAS